MTIFGESAGAISVNYHVVSPMSKGLFHRAISHSGSIFFPGKFIYYVLNCLQSKLKAFGEFEMNAISLALV